MVVRPLRFFDIAAKRAFTTAEYKVLEIAIRYRHGVARRRIAVAVSPFTGHMCYSFAPKRGDGKTKPLTDFLTGD